MNGHVVYIGIGSNVGNRLENLQRAIDMIDLIPKTAVRAVSRVYMTEPVGVTDQDRFFNAVIEAVTVLSPESLREHCKAIENRLGRPEQYIRWSPRIIDLDLLLYDDICLNTGQLVIPHIELHHRKFVLIPLLDLGNPVHPMLRLHIADLLKSCGDASVPVRLLETLKCKKKTDC
jgi:2-amino-4-hydroxy-6-hydroxymethyldihydropteridine diphosphokinase